MYNMVKEGQTHSAITPRACLENLLPIAAEWANKHWWNETPYLGFYPVEFRQRWEYARYVYIDASDEVLAQYRFIGDKVRTKSGARVNEHSDKMVGSDTCELLHLERIVRADWLHSEGVYDAARAYRAERQGPGEMLALVPVEGAEEVPPWPADAYEQKGPGWIEPVPEALKRFLLPIYDNCSGNSLPMGWHQLSIHWETRVDEYLYIDVPDAELSSWAMLGNLEKDWERGGTSLLDIQCIERLPLTWGEAIAYTLCREPSTGMLGIEPLTPNPDALIRGQVVECLHDIQDAWWDEDAPESMPRFAARKGDKLVISRPGAEQDTYSVWRIGTASEGTDRTRPLFQNIGLEDMRVLKGEFRSFED